MRYAVEPTNDFNRQLRHLQYSGRTKLLQKLKHIIEILADGQSLPVSARNHKLSGSFEGYQECHIDYDWLLIYKIEKKELVLALIATGTHDQLFG